MQVQGAELDMISGATVTMPLAEMFWGERYGIVRDPFGHLWSLCTRREQLTPDEVAERVPAIPTDGWPDRPEGKGSGRAAPPPSP